MPRLRAACLLSLCTLAPLGCKSSAPAVSSASDAARTPPRPAAAPLTDEELVRANQHDGLGLGLRIAGTSFPASQPIPIHFAVEDFAAPTAISSGLCSGVTLDFENIADHVGGSSPIDNHKCISTFPSLDEIPLTRGKLKTFDITQRDASYLTLPPGTYNISITWNSFPAGRGTILTRQPYSMLKSNVVQVTVLPEGSARP